MDILENLTDLWLEFSSAMNLIYNFLSNSIADLLYTDIPFVDDILDFLFIFIDVEETSVIDIMFGVGLPVFIIFAFAKWMLDIVL